jgi:hypothetical protein
MRRLTALVALSILAAAAGPAPTSAAEPPGGAIVDVRAAWLVAKGTAAEVRLKVTCHQGVNPTTLEVTLAPDRFEETVARGVLYDPPVCTGDPEQVVVPLSLTGGGPIAAGPWRVQYQLNSCIDLPDCWTVTGGSYRDLQRAPFAAPSDDDHNAELTLVRTRLTEVGNLRVVYDLACRFDSFSFQPLASVAYQATPGGGVVVGTGEAAMDPDGPTLGCGPEPRRLKYVVAVPGPGAFQPGKAYLDTTIGQWHEFLLWATDRRLVRMEAPAR